MSVKVESAVCCRDNSGSNMTVEPTATNWSCKLAFLVSGTPATGPTCKAARLARSCLCVSIMQPALLVPAEPARSSKFSDEIERKLLPIPR